MFRMDCAGCLQEACIRSAQIELAGGRAAAIDGWRGQDGCPAFGPLS
jgi:hypothetical protein